MKHFYKKCSVFCITIVSIIIIQSAILYFGNINWNNHSTTTIYTILFSAILFSTIWLFVKPILDSKIKFEKEINELKRFKRNFNFFQFHYKSIEEFDGFEDLKGVVFGKQNTATQITLILSPNCNNSIRAFKEAYELFQNYSDKISLNILFNIHSNSADDLYKSVAENILALNEHNPEKAKDALIDWYIKQFDLKTWSRKWNFEAPHLLTNKQLQNQHYWCLKNEFTHTPVRIINENLFPDEYEISDIKYFINDFQEEFKYEESLQVV